MFKFIFKFLPSLVFWSVFLYVVLQIDYPQTITEANLIQLFAFFISLFLAITFTLNIFLKNILISISISLGLIFLLFLKALGSLNLITGILTLIPFGLLISYFKKTKRRGLTNFTKMPKLTKL